MTSSRGEVTEVDKHCAAPRCSADNGQATDITMSKNHTYLPHCCDRKDLLGSGRGGSVKPGGRCARHEQPHRLPHPQSGVSTGEKRTD